MSNAASRRLATINKPRTEFERRFYAYLAGAARASVMGKKTVR